MSTVTVSSKYQVVIPKEIREALRIRPGQKMEMLRLGRRIQMVPVVPLSKLKGFVPGIDTRVQRDEDRL